MFANKDFFVGKVVAITGAASGIGAASAREFARCGARLVLADIDAESGGAIAAELRAEGADAEFIATDVTRRADLRAMVELGERRHGRLDVLLNSAGSALRRCTYLEADDALMERSVALNFYGTHYAVQEALPLMIASGGGTILNMASMAHRRGGPGTSIHYAAIKGAVVTLSLGIAREFADRGIRCIPVAPAAVETAFQANSGTDAAMAERLRNDIPLKRFAQPEELARLIVFLASDACSFMTADPVYVSGGGGYR